MKHVGRNEPCPCGSGKKYKNCHMKKEEKQSGRNLGLLYLILFIVFCVIAGVTAYINSQTPEAAGSNVGKVWSEEHQHYH